MRLDTDRTDTELMRLTAKPWCVFRLKCPVASKNCQGQSITELGQAEPDDRPQPTPDPVSVQGRQRRRQGLDALMLGVLDVVALVTQLLKLKL